MFQVSFYVQDSDIRTISTPTYWTARAVLFSLRRAGFAARLWHFASKAQPSLVH